MNIFKQYPCEIAIKFIFVKIIDKLSFLIPNKYFLIKHLGGKVYFKLNESKMMTAQAFGVYEFWKVQLFKKIIKPGMTAIDIGANKGYFTFIFAKLMRDKGTILSFEPDRENYYWLKKSIAVNNYKSIKVFPIAISDKEGECVFYPGKKSGWGSLFFSKNNIAIHRKSFNVPTQTLDKILYEQNINKIDIIKMDVEGADLLVLKGAKHTLMNNKHIKLIMDIDVKQEQEKGEILEFLKSCGFKIFSIGKTLKPVNMIEDIVNKDILAIK